MFLAWQSKNLWMKPKLSAKYSLRQNESLSTKCVCPWNSLCSSSATATPINAFHFCGLFRQLQSQNYQLWRSLSRGRKRGKDMVLTSNISNRWVTCSWHSQIHFWPTLHFQRQYPLTTADGFIIAWAHQYLYMILIQSFQFEISFLSLRCPLKYHSACKSFFKCPFPFQCLNFIVATGKVAQTNVIALLKLLFVV